MKKLLLPLLLSAMVGCVPPTPKPPDPVPPGTPLEVGVVMFSPLRPDLLDHYAVWNPVLRIPTYTGMGAADTLVALKPGQSAILLVETVDDTLVQQIAALGPHSNIYIELGNELAFIQDADYMNAFYKRSIAVLVANGWSLDHIITCGVANIELKTQQWTEQSIVGLPAGVLVGWHAYSNWEANRSTFLQMLAGRPCYMTEWGSYDQSDPQQVANKVSHDIDNLKPMRCKGIIYYQTQSGTGAGNDFGLYNQFMSIWRTLTENVLKSAVVH